jgi:signal transduction histidine kinase
MPTLWVATRRLEDRIEVRIKDNGNGIPAEIVDKIFNPFFTTKPTDQGTGLGLALSNDIVREHGGSIRVETEPGEFTEMIVEVPVMRPVSMEGASEQQVS